MKSGNVVFVFAIGVNCCVLQSRENGLKTEKVWDLLCFIQMRGFGLPIPRIKQGQRKISGGGILKI